MVCDGIGSEKSGTENAFAESRDFAVFVKGAETARLQASYLKPDRIGTDIDCSKRGHGEGSQFTCPARSFVTRHAKVTRLTRSAR